MSYVCHNGYMIWVYSEKILFLVITVLMVQWSSLVITIRNDYNGYIYIVFNGYNDYNGYYGIRYYSVAVMISDT